MLLIDDFNGRIPIDELLRLLDGYRLMLETKGSMTMAQWTKVYITSNQRPEDWYPGCPQVPALMRRLTAVHDFSEKY